MDHPLERMIFFSDAVFAIVITLLVIEIEAPHLAPGATFAHSWREIAHSGASLAAFVLSFLVIGRFWVSHHRLFSHVSRYDDRLLWPNLIFLMAIALMPFATAFFGRNLSFVVPGLVYDLAMLACAVLSLALLRRTVTAGVIEIDVRRDPLLTHPVSVIIAASICVVLGLLGFQWSQIGLATIPFWAWLMKRLAKQ
jgi:uncharacterized membrane protein